MAIRLTSDEIEKCRAAFQRFDKDGSGSIDMWELRSALQGMQEVLRKFVVFTDAVKFLCSFGIRVLLKYLLLVTVLKYLSPPRE
jgi:EF hand domain-containing protein